MRAIITGARRPVSTREHEECGYAARSRFPQNEIGVDPLSIRDYAQAVMQKGKR
jgi:hypothetical protein